MENNIIFTHLTSAAIVGYVMNKLMLWKKIPWVNFETQKINAVLRVILSGIATLGIHWTWGGTWTAGRTLMITIPALAVIAHALFNWAGQYALTHGFERLLDVGRTWKVDPQAVAYLAEAVAAKLATPKA